MSEQERRRELFEAAVLNALCILVNQADQTTTMSSNIKALMSKFWKQTEEWLKGSDSEN